MKLKVLINEIKAEVQQIHKKYLRAERRFGFCALGPASFPS